MSEALQGVTVVDLTHAYAGPLCTHHLGRLGADIVKVEDPRGGDDFRRTPWFSYLNAGKASVALDLKSPDGQEALAQLIARADVLVENYAPGVPARLGVDWGAVHETNPGLVYCSIKGYGEEGPFANYPAMESTVQAMSGISSMAMSEDADPRDPGVAMADAFAGYVAFSAIMVALLERERDGRGRHVTVSMLEAALVLQTASVLSAHEGGERLRRRTNQARFMAKDRRIYANLMFPKWYEAVCTIIGRPDLLEPPWSRSRVPRLGRSGVRGRDREVARVQNRRGVGTRVHRGGRPGQCRAYARGDPRPRARHAERPATRGDRHRR